VPIKVAMTLRKIQVSCGERRENLPLSLPSQNLKNERFCFIFELLDRREKFLLL
jgi:hypothetical protein